jgi:hypothetical protein
MKSTENELVVNLDGGNSGQIKAPQVDKETLLEREATSYCFDCLFQTI